MKSSETQFYFQRFGFCERQILTPPPQNLGLVIVIPCFNEPDLIGSLESLWRCDRPGCAVEIIVVINSGAKSSAEVRLQNQNTFEQAAAWVRTLRSNDPHPDPAAVGTEGHPKGWTTNDDDPARCPPFRVSGTCAQKHSNATAPRLDAHPLAALPLPSSLIPIPSVGRGIDFHLLHFPDLPPKHAGVGLARKIGMDEAARRFDDIGNPQGIIAGFDADCQCQPNYLTAIERHFQEHPRSPGCSIHFEHPLSDTAPGSRLSEPRRGTNIPNSQADEAIVTYELHLRYYVKALRYAGFPYAYHTIGSCMAVRAQAYMQQGGMSKRQAGEDFYFLHKIIPLGNFTELTATTVFPSPRASDRVPFGTGKAVGDYLLDPQSWTYPLQAFLDLKLFFDRLPSLSHTRDSGAPEVLSSLPKSIHTFLKSENFEQAVKEILENTSTEAAFRKRFFHWFNGFQTMKFIHRARDHFYGQKDAREEAERLLVLTGESPANNSSVRELLSTYRRIQAKSWTAKS